MPYRVAHTWWPDQGGSKIPVFSEWYRSFTEGWDRSDMVSKHPTIERINTYQPVFDEVVVHNMHQDGDFVTNVMCESVPGARHCCKKLKKDKLEVPLLNASVNLDHDIIAVEARTRGLLRRSLSRSEVVDAISKFVTTAKKVIPQRCNYDMIVEIEKWLFSSEEDLFKSSWTDQKAHDLQKIFSSYVDAGGLCDIDLEQIFADKDWVQFLSSLDNRPTLVLHVGPPKMDH
jgi:hypothetical protein